MQEKLNKNELIELVRRIMNAEGTEEEIDELQDRLESAIPNPHLSDLIFYPKKPMTPEEIVEEALKYRPIAMPSKMDK